MLESGDIIRGVGKYKVLDFMQSGGFSDLYLGLNLQSNRRVVIKLYQNDKFDDLEQVEAYLRREKAFINIQSKFVAHPTLELIESIVNTKKPGKEKFLLITNYIHGEDFTDWHQNFIQKDTEKPLIYMIRNIFLPLAEYFAFCHSHGVLHRDVSVSNIIISKRKKTGKIYPVVLDFGAALNFDPAKLYATPPLIADLPEVEEEHIYTEGFSSPEVDKSKQYLTQSDIYSYGAVLYYALTKGLTRDEPSESNSSDEDYILNPLDFDSKIDKTLSKIVVKSTQYQPRDRYNSFDQIVEELKQFLHENRNNKPI